MMNYKEKAILNKSEVVINSEQIKEKKTAKKQVKKAPKLHQKSFLGLSYFNVFLTAISTIILSSWIGYILILDPNAVLWINRFLPQSLHIPMALQTAPQTLAVITKEAETENLIMGATIPLGNEILIPFSQTLKSCTENCQPIVELRVYTPIYLNNQELKYSLIDILTIGDLNGTFSEQFKEFSESLKLTNLELIKNAPNTGGLWFNLSGETKDQTSFYGEILYYDPVQKNLSLILPWQSKAKKIPQWQEITGQKYPELLINQSQLFTPLFQIYTLKINPEYNKFEQDQEAKKPYLFLEEISLEKPAISLPEYTKIMPQIKEGLWDLALQHLNALEKEIHPSIWTETATQQKDAIAYHAQLSQKQCSTEQDTMENQITACLFNSNGTVALEHFKALLMAKKKRKLEGILNWLKEDNFNFKQRLEKTIKLNQFNENLKIWQGLIIYSQEGKEKAINWLKKLDNTPQETITKFETILTEIDLTLNENTDYTGHNSRIIGTAIPVENIELYQWQNPTSKEVLKPIKSPQKWYIIDINSFYDGQEWNHFPFEYLKLDQYSTSILPLWKMLGLDVNSPLKIITKKAQGSEEITLANIKGIKLNNNKIQLLAVGIPLDENQSIPVQPLPLAYSESAFNTMDLGKVSLLDLSQIQPELMTKLLPKLWQLLPAKMKDSNVNNTEAILTKIGHWKVKTTDLTGNNEPESILTLYTDKKGNIDTSPFSQNEVKIAEEIDQHTIIFSDQGEIIYNELKENSAEFMMTIADLQNDNPPVLLIDNGQGKYIMKMWSSTQQKFIEFE